MKSWMKITLLIIIIFIAVGTFYYLMFSSFFEGTAPISRESYLELNIYGEINERESNDPLTKIFGSEPPSLNGLMQCIRKAKIDDNIKGIILRPMGSSMGWATIEELRQALRDFKTTGKKVYVYIEMIGNREYYLGVEGDMLFGAPTSTLFINGMMSQNYFFKGTLDKVGVKAEFMAIGKYKNAPDAFTRKNMSDAEREVNNAILDDYFPRFVSSISQARNITETQVTNAIDRGIFTIKEAYKRNLVDTLMYYNEFKDYLEAKDNRRPRLVSYERYKKVPMSKLGVKAKKTFALIYGVGTIVSGIGDQAPEEGLMTSESMANSIRRAAKNKNISAIVMRINSPGGSGVASDIIWKEVVEARKQKPVVVSMSDLAASGGYYIAMAADSIVAQPSSLVGSIGVFAGTFSFEGLYDKLGIDKEEIIRGKNADLFSETKLFSDSQQKLMWSNISDFYQTFVTKAAEGRHMSYEQVDEIGRGRVWTGAQALQKGLVDKLGGLEDAVNIAKGMAGIPLDQPVAMAVYPKRITFLQRVLSSGIEARLSLFPEVLPIKVRNYLKGFKYFSDYEPLTLVPFYPEIR